MCKRLLLLLSVLTCSAVALADPITYVVSINTSSIAGTTGSLDLNFNPGPLATQAASLQILNFTGGGVVGSPATVGDVGGTLPSTLTFDNGTSFNDYFQSFTYGSTLSFDVSLYGPALSSPDGLSSSGSTFAFSMFSDQAGTIPALTTDTTDGFAYLINVNLDGTTSVTNYSTQTNISPSVATTPEPSSLILLATGLLFVMFMFSLRRFRESRLFRILLRSATLLAFSAALGNAAHAQSLGPSNPCPAVGADSGCGVIITVNGDGKTPCPGGSCFSITYTSQPPYDDIEDTLVGIVNNSAVPLTSLVLTSGASGTPVFGFDGDGICGISPNTGQPYSPAPTGCPFGPTGYEGPGTSFGSPSADLASGTVIFNPPIPPASANGGVAGTAYFSLEESITAPTACTDIINNALKTQASGKNVCATFTPNYGYTLAQAAQACGFNTMDWVQQKIRQDDPSPFYVRNVGGSFDPSNTGYVRLTSKKAPYDDPPKGGGYAAGFGGDTKPDNSYPFYYDPNVDLPQAQNGSVPIACTLAVFPTKTLTFHDAPANTCLPGGGGAATYMGMELCTDTILAPGAQAEPAGSYGAFVTHLAGVNSDGTATDLGIGFSWTSNNNGTTGGASINKTNLPADGNGTGGITITNVSESTAYQFPKGLGVLGINGNQVSSPSVSTTLLTGAQVSVSSSGLSYSRVSRVFSGTVTVTNISSGAITGPFQLVFYSLTQGIILTNATSSFGGWSYITVPGVSSLTSGQSLSVNVQFQNPSNLTINAIPVIYSGSFN